jgi:hypothetical protein
MSIGVVFFYELGYTNMLNPFVRDPSFPDINYSDISPADVLPNKIRSELGTDWGQKTMYNPMEIGGARYIPFSIEAKNDLLNLRVPKRQFLKF